MMYADNGDPLDQSVCQKWIIFLMIKKNHNKNEVIITLLANKSRVEMPIFSCLRICTGNVTS